jgi:hypothetical protein
MGKNEAAGEFMWPKSSNRGPFSTKWVDEFREMRETPTRAERLVKTEAPRPADISCGFG